MKIRCLLFICVLCIVSCGRGDRLEYALEAAGDNRPELEKVLNHYSASQDSLKLSAARFLIENMPYHCSRESEALLAYFTEIADINRKSKDSMTVDECRREYVKVNEQFAGQLTYAKLIPDIRIIQSDYLIENIDVAFDCWQNGSFASHLSFEDFCEYILPYRIAREPLEDWRKGMWNRYRVVVDWIPSRDNWKHNTFDACIHLCNHIRDKGFYIENIGEYSLDYPPSVLDNIRLGSCNEYTMATAFIMRSCGVPVAIDYVIQWPFRSKNHSWNSLLSQDGLWYRFMGGERTPAQVVNQNIKKGKVFRKTFAYQENSLFHQNLKYRENIPFSFNTPYMKDVSDLYFDPVDVTVELTLKPSKKTKFVYLAVFDNKDWVPIQWTKKGWGKAVTFSKMEKDIAYLPVYYIDGMIEPAGDPFILTINNQIYTLLPDTAKNTFLTLNRKYPRLDHMVDYSERMEGGKFEVSNNSNFLPAVVVDSIDKIHHMSFDSLYVSPEIGEYRYWRYKSASDRRCNVAELEFFMKDKNVTSQGNFVSSIPADGNHTKEKAFDGNSLTFFESNDGTSGWVGVDFLQSVHIDKIRYLPRNDDNNIRKGDLYELVYWQNGYWNSLGMKIADSEQITYDDVPDNALLLLHNHSRGNEERVFTVKNGNVMWW